MTKKQVNILVCVIQAALAGMLFLPAFPAGGPLNVLDTVRRYEALGFRTDALVFLGAAVCLPALTALGQFLLRERSNFGTGACLSALYTLNVACFSESARQKLAGEARVTGLFYLMILLALAAVGLEVYAFLAPLPAGGGKKGP